MIAATGTLWQRLRHTRLGDAARGHFDGGLDWRLVVGRAKLPAKAAELIGRVVRGTRLSRLEKAEVAGELVAHFQDGLESGESVEQLIDSFGEPVQAAKLIGRAKRRSRPIVVQVWRWSCWSLGATLAVYVLAAAYLLVGSPSPSTNFLTRINERAAAVPEGQRAWPEYRDALLAMGYHVDHERRLPRRIDLRERPGDDNWPVLVAYLEEHKEQLAALRRAAAQPGVGYQLGLATLPEDEPLVGKWIRGPQHGDGPHGPLIGLLAPHVGPLRTAAELLAVDAIRAAMAREPDVLFGDVVAMLGIARQLDESPFSYGGDAVLSTQRRACDAIEHALASEPDLWTDEQLSDLAHRLADFDVDAARWLNTQRLIMHDIIQRIYTDDDAGDGAITYEGLEYLSGWAPEGYTLYLPSLRNPPIYNRLVASGIPATALLLADRRETAEKVDALFDLAIDDLSVPLWQPSRLKYDRELKAMESSSRLRVKYMLVRTLAPPLWSTRAGLEMAKGRAEGVRVGIALELHRRRHGRWPETLDALVPQYIAGLPVDRINGGPLGYRLVDDRPLVYSLGRDGDDDAGRLPKYCKGDASKYHELYSRSASTSDDDWVIWSPRVGP